MRESVTFAPPTKEEIEESIYLGRGVSQEEMSELAAHFNQQVNPEVSKEAYQAAWQRTLDNLLVNDDYKFDELNPLLERVHAVDEESKEDLYDELFAEGMTFFQKGNIRKAMFAFEAALQSSVEHSEGWHMLGLCHTENDEDKEAIQCLLKSLEYDPYNLDSLLALGISYVNEIDSAKALEALRTWVRNNPNFHGIEVQLDDYSDGSLMDEVVQLMEAVAQAAPLDHEVKVVLGVLYNVTLDYDQAEKNFLAAMKDESLADYTLQNKIGATLANSNRSAEALAFYAQALRARPGYARGWLNVGISYANLNRFDEAAKAYLQALNINPRARHIWGYLRVALTSLDRLDLVELAAKENLKELSSALQVSLLSLHDD